MTEIREDQQSSTDKFAERYSRLSDEEIITILKKRNLYQPAAAKAAVDEAIKRGIIYSEQDLFSNHFKPHQLKFSFFPLPDDINVKTKLRKSLTRILFFTGLLPLIEGIFKIIQHENGKAILMIAAAFVWTALAWGFHKTGRAIFYFALLAFVFVATSYLTGYLLNRNRLPFMDIFVAVILIGIVAYLITYLYFLVKNKNEKQ